MKLRLTKQKVAIFLSAGLFVVLLTVQLLMRNSLPKVHNGEAVLDDSNSEQARIVQSADAKEGSSGGIAGARAVTGSNNSTSPAPSATAAGLSTSGLTQAKTTAEEQIQEPKARRDPLLIDLPDDMKEEPSTLSAGRGDISFTVKADWGNADDQHWVWVNFNGSDIKNLLMISGSGELLIFDVYLDDGNALPECNVDLPDVTSGVEYQIRAVWNFETAPFWRKVYVNGELKRECSAESKPASGGKTFKGKIFNFSSL